MLLAIQFDADLRDQIQLPLKKVDVILFVFDEFLEQVFRRAVVDGIAVFRGVEDRSR